MQGFIKFNKGVLRTSWPVKIWLLLLVAANAVRTSSAVASFFITTSVEHTKARNPLGDRKTGLSEF